MAQCLIILFTNLFHESLHFREAFMYTVSSGGYNSRHPLHYFMSRPKGLPCYLLLIVKCPAVFHIGAKEVRTDSDCAMLIRPNVPYQYRSVEGEYTDDWLHFDCDDDLFPENTPLLFHQPIPLGSVVHFNLYIQQIMWEKNYTPEPFQKQNIHMLMQVLLNNLILAVQKKDSPTPYNPFASRLQSLRLSMQSQAYKNFTPQELAQALDVSPSYFQYLYREFFGVPFKTDLINMRIDYAKGLILNTNLKLEQIAQMSGYNSEIHFYRQFRAKTGMTPREYLLTAKRQT